MDYLQEAIHLLLTGGDADTSHFEMSVGVKEIEWPPPVRWKPLFYGNKNEERAECHVRIENELITLRMGWKSPEMHVCLGVRTSTSPFYIAKIDARVYENTHIRSKFVHFADPNHAISEFRYHFKLVTDLDPFLFT